MCEEDVDVTAGYEPATYWDTRLRRNFSLRGVGHHLYAEHYNSWVYRAKARALRKALPAPGPGATALDVGSGVGWVVRQLLGAGYDVVGCDISPYAVGQLSATFPDQEFFQLRLGEDTLPDDVCYDVVTILDVTYHIVDDALWTRGVRDLAAALRPGGQLVVIDAFGAETRDPAAHVRFRSLDMWRNAAAEAGLRLESVRPVYRWLSRDTRGPVTARLPQRLRGPVEFAMESLVPRSPHMRIARFSR